MENRKKYLVLSLVSFWDGFFIYGGLATYFRENLKLPFNSLVTFLIYGFLGGLLIGGVISGIMLFANIIKRQNLLIKILACVLFPITLMLITLGGILTFIPYGIYNLVMLNRKEPPEAT